MPVISTTIPNLVNGISEQNATQRNLTQGETQINAQSSIVNGLSRRPPLEHVSNLLSSQIFSTNTAIHPFIRDGNNQYFIAAYNGGIKACLGIFGPKSRDLLSKVFDQNFSKDDFKFVSVGDTTFVANKSI